MMKWKARTETMNIGVLELGNVTFDEDYIEVSIDICDMSDSLKADVQKAIEIAKTERTREIEEYNTANNASILSTWSDCPVVIDFTYLRVVLEAGKPIDYNIEVGFHDPVNGLEQWDCTIKVDLSGYANELKKAIIKVLVDKFF